jgi:hypothetical protein
MKIKLPTIVFLIPIFFIGIQAQQRDNVPQKASQIGKLNYRYVPSIKEQIEKGTFIPADPISNREKQGRPKLRRGNNVIPGKGSKGPDVLAEKQKLANQIPLKSVSTSFNTTTSTGTPSDPSGAVGADYYIASWNVAFQIFNKDGTPALPAASPGTLFNGEAIGDQIVLYDAAADRYIVTQFSETPNNGFSVAISETNDPTTGGWHVYDSSTFSTGEFPDYTKFSIWSDGYYVTANIDMSASPVSLQSDVWVLERDTMLNGDPAGIQTFTVPGIETNGFYSPQFLNVSDGNMPATGNATLVYMQDDAWSGVTSDHLKLWTVNVDWITPANSTISAAVELPVTEFIGDFDGGSFSNLSQPSGPDIDALQATIMNQAQFRKFGSHNSAVFNFVVDTDPTAGKLAGIRWYELRQTADGQPWTVYQEGTYVAPNGRHAFAGSMAMDSNGNIGMGYSSLSDTESISLRYTGRFNGDSLGVMTGLEGLIIESQGNSNSERYADYAHLTVDSDDSFWFVSEYFGLNGRSNHVAQFTIDPVQPNDVGVSAILEPINGVLSMSEQIKVTISNYGSSDQSNIPISYIIDGGAAVNEVYAGTILAGTSDTYTFSQTVDLSILNEEYVIVASTNLIMDQNNNNDSKQKNVMNVGCMPTSDCSFRDLLEVLQLGSINITSGTCGSGYNNNTAIATDLDRSVGNNKHIGILQTGWAPEEVSIWIDFNDDQDFEDVGEQVLNTLQVSTEFTDTAFSITIPTVAPLGSHIMRIRSWDPINSDQIVGVLNNPCDNLEYGNTEDFTVNIVDTTLSIEDINLGDVDFKIVTKPNNQFEVILDSPFDDKLTFNLYNALGQQLVFNVVNKGSDGKYRYDLDMSYAANGVYLIKVGRGNSFVTGRIIVN